MHISLQKLIEPSPKLLGHKASINIEILKTSCFLYDHNTTLPTRETTEGTNSKRLNNIPLDNKWVTLNPKPFLKLNENESITRQKSMGYNEGSPKSTLMHLKAQKKKN